MKLIIAIAAISLPLCSVAAPPGIIHHQGRLTVDDENYNGTAYFKAAFVNAGEDISEIARATSSISGAGGSVTEVTVTQNGFGFTDPPEVRLVSNLGGSGATAEAVVSNGQVTAINVTNGGSGYFGPPHVFIDPPPPVFENFTVYWNNDGSHASQVEPDDANAVETQIRNVHYGILLGDTSVPNMTTAIPASVFAANLDVRLRLWVSTSGDPGSFQAMTPNQRVASVGYALCAPPPSDGSITALKLAPGAAAMNVNADGSFALGSNASASGSNTIAFGQNTDASGNNAQAFGTNTVASGDHSFAAGSGSMATKDGAIAIGTNANATGQMAAAFGRETKAPSLHEVVFGRFNTDYSPIGGSGIWDGRDRLLVLGNGFAGTDRSNALTVLKSGNTGFGTDSPDGRIHTSDRFEDRLPIFERTTFVGTQTMYYGAKVRARTSEDMEDGFGSALMFQIGDNAQLKDAGMIGAVRDGQDYMSSLVFITKNGNDGLDEPPSLQEKMRITPVGNVGIGTKTPGAPLAVRSTIRATNFDGQESSVQIYEITNDRPFGFEFEYDGAPDRLYLHSRGFSGGNDAIRMTWLKDGKVGIGVNPPTHLLHVNGLARSISSTWATTSDARVKENITPLQGSLDMVSKLRPVHFEYTDEYRQGREGAYDGEHTGFIAQEVKQIFPDMVSTTEEKVGSSTIEDFHVLNSGDLVPHLVAAVKELEAENSGLLKQNAAILDRLVALEDRLAKLEQK